MPEPARGPVKPETFQELLASHDSWRLVAAGASFPPEHPVAAPSDPSWVYWWTPLVGAEPAVALLVLHHLASAGHTEIELGRLAQAAGVEPTAPIAPGHRLVAALTVAASHRLLALTDDPPSIVLYSPIPRPGLGATRTEAAVKGTS